MRLTHLKTPWFVKNESNISQMPDFRWDGVEFAGLYAPPEWLLEQVKDKPEDERRKEIVKQAEIFCDDYTAWCNGWYYDLELTIYHLRQHEDGDIFDDKEDYRFNDPIYEGLTTYRGGSHDEIVDGLNQMVQEFAIESLADG